MFYGHGLGASCGPYGFHIHDDGEVCLVGRLESIEEDKGGELPKEGE